VAKLGLLFVELLYFLAVEGDEALVLVVAVLVVLDALLLLLLVLLLLLGVERLDLDDLLPIVFLHLLQLDFALGDVFTEREDDLVVFGVEVAQFLVLAFLLDAQVIVVAHVQPADLLVQPGYLVLLALPLQLQLVLLLGLGLLVRVDNLVHLFAVNGGLVEFLFDQVLLPVLQVVYLQGLVVAQFRQAVLEVEPLHIDFLLVFLLVFLDVVVQSPLFVLLGFLGFCGN